MSDGLSHAELEALVGQKVAPKVQFYLWGERLFYRIGARWYEGAG